MLPSKIDQKKVSHETGSKANFGFGRALMPSYLGMCPPKAAFSVFGCRQYMSMPTFALRIVDNCVNSNIMLIIVPIDIYG